MELKTPLYDAHCACGGKIVPFAGYLLPVQYQSGVVAEHMAVRTACGLFDVSHMGEIVLRGKNALNMLNILLTNDFCGMYDGQARYSPMCNDEGGVVDDLIVYKYNDEAYFIVVNAANKDKDFKWMKAHEFGDAKFEDISESVAQLALQGPRADEILEKIADRTTFPTKYYSCNFNANIKGMPCVISKTGYTGEGGYEIYIGTQNAEKLWNLLLDAGKDYGLIPCGLGARDTLRLEAAMPLYGHEMDDEITPIEAGLGFFVKMNKTDFIGKSAINAKGEPQRKRVGLKVTGRGIAREHCDVYSGDKLIGKTTSGTHCPYIGAPVAMALIKTEFSAVGTQVDVEIRGKRVAAEVVALPFYKKSK